MRINRSGDRIDLDAAKIVSQTHRLSLDRIAEAATVIDPVFLDSPQFRAESLEEQLGCRLVVKVETVNPIRSFKGRGTEYLTASLSGRPHLVCATAGNFGQGMAYSARKRELTLTIFASETANPLKVERMRGLGAEVRLVGEDFDAAHLAAEGFAEESDARMVEDGRDPAISEGAGTIGLELLRWPEPFDAVLVPLGDGALLAGVARWVKAHRPATRMIGVCASGAPAMERSWRAGEVRELERTTTIADGIAVRVPFTEALADLTGLVDDILLIEDDTMLAAMRQAHQDLGIVLEPAGAAGLAALMAYRERFRGQLVGTILSGGNITDHQMRQWLGS
jgi:threonine dehydratase